MRPFLDNYIASLSSRRQERVASILEEAKLAKDQLDLISSRLTNLGQFAPVFLNAEAADSLISASDIESNVRIALQQINELYEVSNLVSLLLDSHSSLLGSDVKALEDQLSGLEKMAANYAFLLSDGGAYDYAFLETFSDERNREFFEWDVPDRSGQIFGDGEQAYVRADEGVLAIPADLANPYGISAHIVKGNATAFVVSDTGIHNAVSASSSTGWRISLSSATPITSSLPEGQGAVGSQLLLEFRLSQAAPASEIKLVPFVDMPMELVQVILFPSDDNNDSVTLMDDKISLNQSYTLHFPMQGVRRFQVVLNQPTYSRIAQQTNMAEEQYRRLDDEVRVRLAQRHPYERRLLQQFVLSALRDTPGTYGSIPTTDFSALWGPLARLQLDAKTGSDDLWNTESQFETVLGKLIQQTTSLTDAEPQPVLVSAATTTSTGTSFDYQYNMGLQRIAIGTSEPAFKAVFVSKPIDSPGDMGEVRIKVSDNAPAYTSVEYSVSTASSPTRESDWLPILPVNMSIVQGERFLPDSSGLGYLRFAASRAQGMTLYRNGRAHTQYTYVYDATNNIVIGLRVDTSTYSSADIFTIDYTPAQDYTTVDFRSQGFASAPLVQAFDANGAGEGFVTTGGRNQVSLSHHPYIDYSEVAQASYSATLGLTPYQPIVVRLEDGTNAINLTNYKGGIQTPLPTSGYYYVHNNNTLLFNTDINQNFRVYYQYLQNNTRVRVVLRVNSQTFVSPTVDFYHLKAKTRRPDAARTL